jgi:hypothetical protein
VSRRAERLAEQDEFLRDMEEATSLRLKAETAAMERARPIDDPCPINGRHSFWTSNKDGKRRCYYCCAVREGRVS